MDMPTCLARNRRGTLLGIDVYGAVITDHRHVQFMSHLLPLPLYNRLTARTMRRKDRWLRFMRPHCFVLLHAKYLAVERSAIWTMHFGFEFPRTHSAFI